MKHIIRKFGTGLHIVLPKSEGWKEGQEIELTPSAERNSVPELKLDRSELWKLLKTDIENMIEQKIEDAKRGF